MSDAPERLWIGECDEPRIFLQPGEGTEYIRADIHEAMTQGRTISCDVCETYAREIARLRKWATEQVEWTQEQCNAAVDEAARLREFVCMVAAASINSVNAEDMAYDFRDEARDLLEADDGS